MKLSDVLETLKDSEKNFGSLKEAEITTTEAKIHSIRCPKSFKTDAFVEFECNKNS